MIAHISDDGREQSVLKHLQGTAEIAEKEAKKLELGNIAWICGIMHDIGKMCVNFKNYITYSFQHGGDKSKSVPHSACGAHYVYYDSTCKPYFRLLREIVAVVIASHHGVYDCVKPDGSHRSSESDRWNADENYEEAVGNFKRLYEDDKSEMIAERMIKANEEIDNVNKKIRELSRGESGKPVKSERTFYQGCLVRLLLSFLIYGDWKDTENFMREVSGEDEYNTPELWKQCLKNYQVYMDGLRKQKNGSDRIKLYREEISRECADAYKLSPGVYRMSVPTGGGKTLSSLNFALRHCVEYKKERIFYISPYLSILEQNAQVIRDVINNDDIILEHHSNVAYTSECDNQDNQGKENKNSLAIDWQQPIVLTTMVQLMNTLFSDRMQCIRRMHWLADSVIIIDEVQAMPVKCISTFNLMINFLAHVCNATILLCTATQPALGKSEKNRNDIISHKIIFGDREELISDVEKRFIQFERTRIINATADKGYGTEALTDFVAGVCGEYESTLVILNTKAAVRKLFDNIKGRIGNSYVYYLTTNMCPEHRSNAIKEIKDILERIREGSGERILVISTNLIEAGVDISFRTVIRALTGLDSIVQAAGRCNRQGECEYGNVYIINTNENTGRLKDTSAGARASGHVIRDLQYQDNLNELFMPESINKYYREYYRDRSEEMDYSFKGTDVNSTLFKLLSTNSEAVAECGKMEPGFNTEINQAFKSAWSRYKMIDDDTVGIIVPYKKGREYCEEIRNAYTVGEIKKCLKKAQRYTVNLYKNKLQELINRNAVSVCDLYGTVYVLNDCYYDDNLGITTDFENYIF